MPVYIPDVQCDLAIFTPEVITTVRTFLPDTEYSKLLTLDNGKYLFKTDDITLKNVKVLFSINVCNVGGLVCNKDFSV